MKKVLIDNTVLLNVLLENNNYKSSAKFLSLAEQNEFELFISGSSFSELFNIIKDKLGESEAVDVLKKVHLIINIISADEQLFELALYSSGPFRNSIELLLAKKYHIDVLVSENQDHYHNGIVKVLDPVSFLGYIETIL